MYKVVDVVNAFSRDAMGRYVFDLIQDSIDSSRLSFALFALEKELQDLPEFSAYQKKHDELIDKYGREPGDEDKKARERGIKKMIDEKCEPEKLEGYKKEEAELLETQIERDIRKIPQSLFDGQKIKGIYTIKIFPFIDLEK